MKAKQTVIGEPAQARGNHPLATRLVENNPGIPLARPSWLALAALAGAILRLFHRPGRQAPRRHPGGPGVASGLPPGSP